MAPNVGDSWCLNVGQSPIAQCECYENVEELAFTGLVAADGPLQAITALPAASLVACPECVIEVQGVQEEGASDLPISVLEACHQL